MRLLFLLGVLKTKITRNNFIVKSLLFSLLFSLLAVTVINYKSYISFAGADYPILSMLYILFLIFIGSFASLSRIDMVLLFITAVLFGVNIELVASKIAFLRNEKTLGFTFGAGFISLAATGCASCGLSLVSVAGLAGVIALLPFHGAELYLLSIGILLVSLFYNLQTLARVCKIT